MSYPRWKRGYVKIKQTRYHIQGKALQSYIHIHQKQDQNQLSKQIHVHVNACLTSVHHNIYKSMHGHIICMSMAKQKD